MKGKYIAIFAVFLFIVFFFAMEARAVNWELYLTTSDGNRFYYDPQSITWVSNAIVQLSKRVIWSKETKLDALRLGGRVGLFLADINHTIALMEFNCREEKFQKLLADHYNDESIIIQSDNHANSSWKPIVPGSPDETLFNIVCGSR